MQGHTAQGTTRAERRRQIEQGSRRSARPARRTGRRRSRPHDSLPNVVARPARTELLLVEDKASRSGRRASELALRGRRRRRTAGTLVAAATLALAGIAGATWAGLVPGDISTAALRLVGLEAPVSAGTATTATTDATDAAEPVRAAVTPSAPAAAPSAASTETADERLLSTVDQCRALGRGELAVDSAAYRSLVVSAGAADLDAWCADLTGDAARTQS